MSKVDQSGQRCTIELQSMPSPLDSTQHIARSMVRKTEEWCAIAAAKGDGYRLFRSDLQYINSVQGYFVTADFQILAPGEGAPGTGLIYGPWHTVPNAEQPTYINVRRTCDGQPVAQPSADTA